MNNMNQLDSLIKNIVELIDQIDVTPNRDCFLVVYNAYEQIINLRKFQDNKSKEREQKEKHSDGEKSKDPGVSRLMNGIFDILYPYVEKEDEELESLNNIFSKRSETFYDKFQEKLKYDNKRSVIKQLSENSRRSFERKYKALREKIELADNYRDLYDKNLYNYIYEFGEVYYMTGYCMKKDLFKFLTEINVLDKKEEFVQKYFLIGKQFIENITRLINIENYQRNLANKNLEMKKATERAVKLEEQLGGIVQPEQSDKDKKSKELVEPKSIQQSVNFAQVLPALEPLLKLDLPEVTKYKLVSSYDLLNAILFTLPIQTADLIELEDVENVMEQRYIMAFTNPQELTFQTDEGNFVGTVIVRDIFNVYHVFTVEEEGEGAAPEIVVDTIGGTESFNEYFSQMINQYELSVEEDQELAEDEGVYLSTVTDVLKIFEQLNR